MKRILACLACAFLALAFFGCAKKSIPLQDAASSEPLDLPAFLQTGPDKAGRSRKIITIDGKGGKQVDSTEEGSSNSERGIEKPGESGNNSSGSQTDAEEPNTVPDDQVDESVDDNAETSPAEEGSEW